MSWVLTNSAEDHHICLTALQQQQCADNTILPTATAEWSKRLNALKKLVADYQAVLITIRYGE